ncbi:MAG: hypothetical protein IT162_17565 [Bryobacterales bacterium]|nr:hypothetical protein [Bryobacterales bacterium]
MKRSPKPRGNPSQIQPRLDRRSLDMHRAIAAKLLEEGGERDAFIAETRAAWEQRECAPEARRQRNEWRALLALPLAELAARISEDTPEMTRLRRSSPFAPLLTPQERWAIYRGF